MSLRKKLALFFLLIVVVPLLTVAVVSQKAVYLVLEYQMYRQMILAQQMLTGVIQDQSRRAYEYCVTAVGDPRVAEALLAKDEDSLRQILEPDIRNKKLDLLEITWATGEKWTEKRGGVQGLPLNIAASYQVYSGENPVATLKAGMYLDDQVLAEWHQRSSFAQIIFTQEGILNGSENAFRGQSLKVGDGRQALKAEGNTAKAYIGKNQYLLAYQPLITGDKRQVFLGSLYPVGALGESLAWVEKISYLAVGLVGLLSVFLAGALANTIVKPLEGVTAQANRITGKYLAGDLPLPTQDEVERLKTSFELMVDTLEENIKELSLSRQKIETVVQRLGEVVGMDEGEKLPSLLLDLVVDILGVDHAAYFESQKDGTLALKNQKGQVALPEGLYLTLGTGIAGQSALQGEPVYKELTGQAYLDGALNHVYSLPLAFQDKLYGVLNVYSLNPMGVETQKLLSFLVQQMAMGIQNAYLRSELEIMSVTDELTGISNRRYFMDRFRYEWERARRFGHPLSLLFFDLDRFKTVNDTYGHATGDKVLQGFAKILRENARGFDVAARFGGEEFILLLVESNQKQAFATAERIREKVENSCFPGGHEGETIRVTCSIGVATTEGGQIETDTLLALADRALYRAKEKGRNRVEIALFDD